MPETQITQNNTRPDFKSLETASWDGRGIQVAVVLPGQMHRLKDDQHKLTVLSGTLRVQGFFYHEGQTCQQVGALRVEAVGGPAVFVSLDGFVGTMSREEILGTLQSSDMKLVRVIFTDETVFNGYVAGFVGKNQSSVVLNTTKKLGGVSYDLANIARVYVIVMDEN
jgi:hypothetical protein